MAVPTQQELEARRDQIEVELARLAKLPASYSVKGVTVDNAAHMEALRREQTIIKAQIQALEEPCKNIFNGPEIIVT